MSKYKRDKTTSMADLAYKISIANENQEGENWIDVLNLCGEADLLIAQYEARITALEANIDGFWEALHNSYNVESREEIEKDCVESWAKGTSPLAVALHYVWKREPKVAAFEAELAKHQWISVEDRLPGKRTKYPEYFSVEVLVFTGVHFSVGSYNYEDHIWRSFRNIVSEEVTHWKPITTPKDSDKEQEK